MKLSSSECWVQISRIVHLLQGMGVKKPTTTGYLHHSNEMEFEDYAGCFECHQSGAIALFWDMDDNYLRPSD